MIWTYPIETPLDPFKQGDWYTTCGLNLFFPKESVSTKWKLYTLSRGHNFQTRWWHGVMLGITAAPLTCNLFQSRLQWDTLASRNSPKVSSKPFFYKLFQLYDYYLHNRISSGWHWAVDVGDGQRLRQQTRLVQL
jgi:hypothetical protein